MSNDIRKRMFNEMEQKFVFDEARNAAYSYAERALERNVFPSDEAIADLAANRNAPFVLPRRAAELVVENADKLGLELTDEAIRIAQAVPQVRRNAPCIQARASIPPVRAAPRWARDA